MRETREGRQELKQEMQANQFAIELLSPVSRLETFLSRDPDLMDEKRERDTIVSTTAAIWAVSNGQLGLTDITETHATAWTDSPDLDLWKQTRVGKDGHAVKLLRAERTDNDEGEVAGANPLGTPGFR